MSGRHGTGSCCCAPSVIEKKLSCIKDDYKVSYKVGGEFLSRSDYVKHLVDNNQWAGMLDLEEIRYEITKPDRGEYQADLCSWFWGAAFYDPDQEPAVPEDENYLRNYPEWRNFSNYLNNQFMVDEDVGFHIPKTWDAILGDPEGTNIRIVRHLSKNTSYKRYINGVKADILNVAGFKKDDDDSYVHMDEILTSGQYVPDPDMERSSFRSYRFDEDGDLEQVTMSIKTEIDNKWNYIAGGDPTNRWQKPGVPHTQFYAYTNDIQPINYQIEIKDFVVEWTTKIFYNGEEIFDELNCIVYRTEFNLFGNGAAMDTSYFPTIHRIYLPLTDYRYGANVNFVARQALLDYARVGYCLTYPFFATGNGQYDNIGSGGLGTLGAPTGGFSHYFNEGNGDYKSVDDDEKYTIKDGHGDGRDELKNKDEAKGDKELTWFHASPEIFNKIQITSRDFIVFNPFADETSIGRDVTPDELSRYWIGNPRNTNPTVNDIVFGYEDGKTSTPEENIKKIASVCWLKDDRWPKLKEYADEKDLQPDDEACEISPGELREKRITASEDTFIFVDDMSRSSARNGKSKAIFPFTMGGYSGWGFHTTYESRWTPYFKYTDSKFKAGDLLYPQSMIAKDDKLDGAIPIQDPPEGWPGDFEDEDGTVSTFRKYTVSNPVDDEEKIEYVDKVLVVSFRRNRNAKEAMENPQPFFDTLTPSVGDKVYYPVGSDDISEITKIVETNALLQPHIIDLDTEDGVSIQDVELVKDKYYYALTGRAYYLQLRYLSGDFANPFKYKVNQIDIVNGDIDVDNFGDEIAGPIGFDEGNPVHLTLSKNIEWKFIEDTKYYNLIELDGNEEAKIELADDPPHALPDGFIGVSPIRFIDTRANREELQGSGYSPPPEPKRFPEKLFPLEDGFRLSFADRVGDVKFTEIKRFLKENTEFLEDVFETVEYTNNQKPATGYFVGSNIKLKFQLEEVQQWKNGL